MGARIVVTGSEGFVGRHLRAALRARGCEVVGADRPGSGAEIGVDLSDARFGAGELLEHCGKLDGAIWLAATIARGSSVDEAARANLRTIADAAVETFDALHERFPGAHFVYCSSFKTYGPGQGPIDPERPPQRPDPHSYGCAKALAERLLAVAAARSGARYAVVRPTCVYGPGQHSRDVIPVFLRGVWEERAPVVFGHGREVRDDVFAPDLAHCLAEACLRRAEGAFHAAGERPRTLLEVAEACCAAVAGLGGPSGLRPVVDPDRPAKPWLDRVFDSSRSRDLLGHRPTPLAAGLAAEARWLHAGASPDSAVGFCPPPRTGEP